jgi:Domain of unknown function (DUF4328)/Protein of unknown function (DUF2510)
VSDQSGYPGAPPGWYPDPAGGPGQRWWDGYAWTEATVLPQHPPPPPPPSWTHAAPPAGPPSEVAPWAVAADRLTAFNTEGSVKAELGMTPVARVAVVLPAVYYIAQLINIRIEADQWRSLGHQFRVAYDAAQAGRSAPQYHTQNLVSPLVLVVGLATLAAVIVACIWQHRAATAARALGFPARRSPAWGVGSWFVPVVNLWMPYGALRDCLPPGDPHRAHVLRWWIAWIVGTWLTIAAGACALVSSGAALAVSIPAALALLAVAAWAPGVVTAIAAAHRGAATGAVSG